MKKLILTGRWLARPEETLAASLILGFRKFQVCNTKNKKGGLSLCV